MKKDTYAVLLAVVVSLVLTLFGCATNPAANMAQPQHGSLNDFKGTVVDVQERACPGESHSYVSIALIDERRVMLGENGKMVMAVTDSDGMMWVTFGVWNPDNGNYTLDMASRHRFLPGMNACADLFGGDTKLKPSGDERVPGTGPGLKNSI